MASNVDDYLPVGPHDIVTSFLEHLRVIWKTTNPVYLAPGDEFSFLGITLEVTSVGLLLHQRAYTEAFLKSTRMLPLRGKEQQQENLSTMTRMPSHHLT